jgi:hypothetical protein
VKKYYRIVYKNTTFGNTTTEYAWGMEESDLEDHIFGTIHKYYGNHALGHGVFTAEVSVYDRPPKDFVERYTKAAERRLASLRKQVECDEESLRQLASAAKNPPKEAVEVFNISGGRLPEKECVIKDYFDGDEKLFHTEFGKYYE